MKGTTLDVLSTSADLVMNVSGPDLTRQSGSWVPPPRLVPCTQGRRNPSQAWKWQPTGNVDGSRSYHHWPLREIAGSFSNFGMGRIAMVHVAVLVGFK